MNQILFTIIQKKVFKQQEMQEISLNSTDKKSEWIFDFKGVSLSKVFLEEYAKEFWKHFSDLENVCIGGMETGANALIAGVSLHSPQSCDVTPFYIRKSRKKSDLANRIEGEIDGNKPIVLVDDILNRGNTIRKQITQIEEKGFRVSAVFVCIRFRDMDAYQDLLDKGIRIVSIFDLNDFKEVLPVANLKEKVKDFTYLEKYIINYKITLTSKPNLYLVVPKSAPVSVDVYIYCGVDDGSFFCINSEDGSIVWSYKVMFGAQGKRIFSTAAIYKDKVMFGAYDGNFYCLNRFSGKVEWVFFDADWVGSSPCIDEKTGLVFIGLEFGLFTKRGGVAAIKINTGEAVWKNYTMKGLTHASPAVCGDIVVCGCNDNVFYAFNKKTGEIVWKFETQGEIKYSAVFDSKRKFVIFGCMDGGVYVLNVNDGTLYHKFQAMFGFYANPVLHGDLIIIGSLDKYIYCFNLVTKKTEWKFETAGRIFASPELCGPSVFIGSNDGCLYELNVDTGALISKNQLSERIVNKIIAEVTSGKKKLFITTHAGELYVLNEK